MGIGVYLVLVCFAITSFSKSLGQNAGLGSQGGKPEQGQWKMHSQQSRQ